MIHIKEAIIVEGKYDRERLKKVTDAPVICTGGFRLYKSPDLIESIRHLAQTRGIIILTDSDRAGFRIRNYLKRRLGNQCSIKNAYIPAIPGKERRKEKPGKEGLLGVEGMDYSALEKILAAATEMNTVATEQVRLVTKADLFADGFSGHNDSAARRAQLAAQLHLPPRISTNALLELLNKTGGYPAYQKVIQEYYANQKEQPLK
ncbi:toprim domain-containing protein [Ructibacterium gallinarum]|uniref:DUF4093 domain-containing protein n=1 Tax=Ructibacterium gallinarum TaxID=2779355 RepID=A0A9D5RCG0_9FIRM|nr:DUF4093 domain-containing protein [Ructibacterium gallinarum]MBE5040963.1 DUF4093 domain-containing protein [Ructibacterium gallinarum]